MVSGTSNALEVDATTQTIPAEYFAQQLAILNRIRAEHGAGPLTIDVHLQRSSQEKANELADNALFSHTNLDGSSPFDRMKKDGFNINGWAGQNIGRGWGTPEAVMTAYTTGPGEVAPDGTPIEHYANIVRKEFNVCGVGIADGPFGRSWVNDFGQVSGTPAPPPPPPGPVPPPAGAPTIAKIAPSHAAVGAWVIIQGTGMDARSEAFFNGVPATEYGIRDTIGMQARIPTGAVTGPLYVQRPSDGAKSAPVAFTIDSAPAPPGPPPPVPSPGQFAVTLHVATIRPGRMLAIVQVTGGQSPLRVTGDVAGRQLPNLPNSRWFAREANARAGEVVSIQVEDATGAKAKGTGTVP